ncbi:MAG: DUF3800 domain-containing protein [Verrucomicrobiota bacterium]
MLVFIDESGDPGLKLSAGSSRYFVIGLLVFEDHEEATAADQRIQLLKREMGFNASFEFHFNSLRADYRKTFLKAISSYDFFYFGIVINKENLSGEGFQFKESFYKYTCGLVFNNAKPHLNHAIVIVDGSGSREFRKQFASYLRKRINDKDNYCIKKVKVQDSKDNNLIQMTDMICGAIARSYSKKSDAMDYRKLISHREIFVQFWPK